MHSSTSTFPILSIGDWLAETNFMFSVAGEMVNFRRFAKSSEIQLAEQPVSHKDCTGLWFIVIDKKHSFGCMSEAMAEGMCDSGALS